MEDADVHAYEPISINGKVVAARKGEMIIAAADRTDDFIPRFCYHPRMEPVGMCRQCLVEVEGPRGPMMVVSCMTPVAEGQIVRTETDQVKRAEKALNEAKSRGEINFHDLIADTDVAKVSAVGIGMRSQSGVAAQMFKTLRDEGINIKVIATSEIKISVLVDRKYMELAVQSLHDAFGLDKST